MIVDLIVAWFVVYIDKVSEHGVMMGALRAFGLMV